jgi:hypothetical protein
LFCSCDQKSLSFVFKENGHIDWVVCWFIYIGTWHWNCVNLVSSQLIILTAYFNSLKYLILLGPSEMLFPDLPCHSEGHQRSQALFNSFLLFLSIHFQSLPLSKYLCSQ